MLQGVAIGITNSQIICAFYDDALQQFSLSPHLLHPARCFLFTSEEEKGQTAGNCTKARSFCRGWARGGFMADRETLVQAVQESKTGETPRAADKSYQMKP